ncbi:response regulator [uncultured Nocardioides sp.]|uniref:hybrid sensor histidine kinase/response regulator n=1 Tax=uncultured Nocardioides sp. TaxID=198441 RepID=UPI002632E1F4|nr:response regulator [uncultured Nocardioides sp.]
MDLSDLYRDIVETSPDGIWVIDLDGRTIYANPAIARLHRIPLEALSTLTMFDILDETGRGQFASHLEQVRQGHVNATEVEVQWVRSDGDLTWVMCREAVLRDDRGHPRAVLYRFSDDTDRHELIASLRASEDALEDQVAQNNFMQAVASAANQAASLAEILVHARSMVLLHDDWERARAFVPATHEPCRVEPFYAVDDDREADVDDPRAAGELLLAQRAYDERRPVWDEQRLTIAVPVVLGDVAYAVVAITSAPPLYRHEMIEKMAVRVTEQLARVAERERARAELSAARDAAMEASRQKSEFLATMSHEIRTPLNGVIGLNNLLLRTELAPEQQRLSSGVQVASRTLLGLINDILDFSKIEAGALQLERLAFDVRLLLEQVAEVLTEAARDKGLDLVVSCHPDVPAQLAGDPTRLAQVVTNLASNAVKFTEHGGVTIRATAAGDDDRVQLTVEVSDTGVGVPQAKLEHLFDPFTQADSSTTRIYGGTGLGLAISREIVQAMDGTLSYAPNAANSGRGSVFTVTVPLDESTDGDGAEESADAQARALLSELRVLVVDDSETSRLVTREQLAWWGIDADSASSAEEALPMLRGATYDMALIDVARPDPDGLDLTRQLRAGPAGAAVRVLLATTQAATLDRDAAREAGVDELLNKPVLAGRLRSTLLRLLAGQPAQASPAERLAAVGPSRGSILVVEDNPVNQMVATGLLAALGYTSDTAEDGVAAVEAALSGSFDAILMDVQMPHMDGYTATRHIRAHETGPRRPIIAMTAAAVEGERERCLEAGMDDYLTKPVDPARLAETLDRWVPQPTTYTERLDIDRLDELRELDDPGEGSYVDRAIRNFLGYAEQDLAAMTAAVDAGDAAELRAIAHRLAGAALNLGARSLGESARVVEEHAVSESLDEAAAALPVLAEELTRDLDALRAYQREQFSAR